MHNTRANPDHRPHALRSLSRLTAAALLASALTVCNNSDGETIFGAPGFFFGGPARFSVFYNDPGVSEETSVDKKVDLELVELIDNAESTVDLAIYNLGRQSVMDALIRAEERGVRVRLVGDVDEAVTDGYRSILRTNIPFSLGNSTAIQHNKFCVADGRFLFMGTANITDSDLTRNNNNFMIIESPEIAAVFTQEFEQMFFGRYGSRKEPFTTRRNFTVNFTPVEVYFSPYDGQDAMDRLVELIDGAQSEIHFMIFAFTHDEMAAALIRAARRGVRVQGIHDKTFIRGVSMEAPRLYNAGRFLPTGPFVREDGNEFTSVKGVSAHGGKLHAKTIIIDRSIVSTGSFNWSTNAVDNNDENMLVVHNPLAAQVLLDQWQRVWDVSRPITNQIDRTGGDVASYGDIVISEALWSGSYTGSTYSVDDDYIEFYNASSRPIDISHWYITWEEDEARIFPIPDRYNWYEPGVASRHLSSGRLIIPAGGYFLLKSLNSGVINDSDLKVSGTKEFSLASSSLRIRLYDTAFNLIDEAGDGGPPPAGRLDSFRNVSYSMERFFYPIGNPQAGRALPGNSAGAWYTSNGNNLTGASLRGLGQIESSFGVCTTSGTAAERCTVGTPNYTGATTSLAAASIASGGENAYANRPLAAYATGSNSAEVRMRWAMQAAPTVSGGACPCTVQLKSGDPSVLTLTTATQTPGASYDLVVGSALDITGAGAAGGSISFTGAGLGRAALSIDRVYPARSGGQDIVTLRASSGGTLSGLGIYYFDAFASTPQLLYRLADAPITNGQYVEVRLSSACDLPCSTASVTSEDRRIAVSPSFNITANPSGAASSAGLTATNTWEVFSPIEGLSSTDGLILISYDLSQPPLDVMCYSNRDGDMSQGLMRGGMRRLFRLGPGVYDLGAQLPVDQANDFNIQSRCSHFFGSGDDYLQRTNFARRADSFACVNC